MRIASLDLGSNTTLLLIADMNGKKISQVIADEAMVTKMGQGVNASRQFHADALTRMRECLTAYSKIIHANRCDKVIAVATSAARDVTNANELMKIGYDLQIPIHIISGEREAAITFSGALSDRADAEGCAVVDVGGGSTEIISQVDGLTKGQSVDVGSVRLTEMFVKVQPILASVRQEIEAYVARAFSAVQIDRGRIRELVAVAGTPTTLAAIDQQMDFSDELVNGYELNLQKIENWIARLSAMTVSQREVLPGMQPKRADVIVSGAIILASTIRSLKQTRVTVSTRGVRYGVALAWQDF